MNKKIVGFGVCGKGEADRYLEATLKEFKRLCDETIIVCNNCSEKEISLINSYGFKIVIDNREWGREQWRIKEDNAKKYIKADWVVALDMDETFDKNFTREELEKLCEKGGTGYYFYIVNLYNEGYSKKWSFFNVRLFNTEYGFNWEKKALHCGLAPRIAYEWGNYAPFILKHYGLKEKEDRDRKVERYNKYDPNKKFKSGNYYNFLKSIEVEAPFDEDEMHKLIVEEVNTYQHKIPNKIMTEQKIRKYWLVKNHAGRIIDIPDEQLKETLEREGFELMSKEPIIKGGIGVGFTTTETPIDVKEEVEVIDIKEEVETIDVSEVEEIKDAAEEGLEVPEPEVEQEVSVPTAQIEEEDVSGTEEATPELTCIECGFVAKSVAGLSVHGRKHK